MGKWDKAVGSACRHVARADSNALGGVTYGCAGEKRRWRRRDRREGVERRSERRGVRGRMRPGGWRHDRRFRP